MVAGERSDVVRDWCRPDGIGTVLHEEWDSFLQVKDRLRRLVENQLTNFRSTAQLTCIASYSCTVHRQCTDRNSLCVPIVSYYHTLYTQQRTTEKWSLTKSGEIRWSKVRKEGWCLCSSHFISSHLN